MTDQPPTAAPVAAPAIAPRAPFELNLVALALIGVITLANIVAVARCGVSAGVVTLISGGPLTGLFAIINRSAPR